MERMSPTFSLLDAKSLSYRPAGISGVFSVRPPESSFKDLLRLALLYLSVRAIICSAKVLERSANLLAHLSPSPWSIREKVVTMLSSEVTPGTENKALWYSATIARISLSSSSRYFAATEAGKVKGSPEKVSTDLCRPHFTLLSVRSFILCFLYAKVRPILVRPNAVPDVLAVDCTTV